MKCGKKNHTAPKNDIIDFRGHIFFKSPDINIAELIQIITIILHRKRSTVSKVSLYMPK